MCSLVELSVNIFFHHLNVKWWMKRRQCSVSSSGHNVKFKKIPSLNFKVTEFFVFLPEFLRGKCSYDWVSYLIRFQDSSVPELCWLICLVRTTMLSLFSSVVSLVGSHTPSLSLSPTLELVSSSNSFLNVLSLLSLSSFPTVFKMFCTWPFFPHVNWKCQRLFKLFEIIGLFISQRLLVELQWIQISVSLFANKDIKIFEYSWL